MNIHDFMKFNHTFRWGGVSGDDCMTFAASWCRFSTGQDPAEHLRGTYRNRVEAYLIMDRCGGPEQFMDQHLSAIGAMRIPATQEVRDGDIGLVRVMTADEDGRAYVGEVAGIAFGPLWLSLGPGGIVGKKVDTVIARWRLPK